MHRIPFDAPTAGDIANRRHAHAGLSVDIVAAATSAELLGRALAGWKRFLDSFEAVSHE
ncbi:hypothetical protein ABZ667_16290 [Streptomyces lavendulae]|uniref:hypothetical protein n=1 Tax=Streptomyces lavendulae TaxID=1914 RepID=UPI00340BAD33